MIRLTAPNGKPVYIDAKSIMILRDSDHNYAMTAKSVVVLIDGQIQAVVETIDKIHAMIKEA